MKNSIEAPESANTEKKRELTVFIFLAVILAPVLSVVIVGVYGLSVWLLQHFTGPPAG
ncbi:MULTISPECIES: periplasmic nitrate reductase, NapE protein [Hahella]|uniref:periplasmic nitrate reductase, NapE protein n=1 Tax=Hahella TaxID=158481 RepID=UPI000A020C0C|nr:MULTISPECIES: periplasmic nitrate reductase, NapE protein [Hahella]MBU6955625.1 periplasmic nitrate reductase, NapE protein [Hahella sp. HN01]